MWIQAHVFVSVCTCMHAPMCACAHSLEEHVECPGVGGDCELLSVGAGN